MPKRGKRVTAILDRMHKVSTSGGRLFAVSVQGSRVTLSDTMVAGPHYLRVLEEQFSSAADLLRCFRAWEAGDVLRPGDIADDQNKLIKRWTEAHHVADASARRWLSEPKVQTFRLRLVAC